MIDKKLQDELIKTGRNFMKAYSNLTEYDEDFESDQNMKLQQPPLVKAPMTDGPFIPLTRDFSRLDLKNDAISLFRDRRSARVYSRQEMSLDQLSFLLWATQGIKKLRGKSYATLRTVPSGGARHPFETYLMVRDITGLKPGAYHYLPMEHALEYLGTVENIEDAISQSLCEQSWASKGNVVFYWTVCPYRAEWRYGIYAHRTALIDAGHLGQNLYLACTALGLGTCGIAAFEHEKCNELFSLDGENEFVVYTAPVGTVRECDLAEEDAFYKFVEDEGL